jgi:hypothetical protein
MKDLTTEQLSSVKQVKAHNRVEGAPIMYTYTCCRCMNCTARIVLEDRADPDTDSLHRPPRPRQGREACPYCRAVFMPASYYVTESELPLLLRA